MGTNLKLSDRIRAYLKTRSDVWVHRDDIFRIAKSKGYSPYAIKDALEVLEHSQDVASMRYTADKYGKKEPGMVSTGMYYRWYDVSEEEQKHLRDIIEYFNSLP